MKALLKFFLFQYLFMTDEGGSFMGGGGSGDGGGDGTGGNEGGTPPNGDGNGAGGNTDGGITYQYPEGLDPSFHGNPTLLKYANEEGKFNQAEIAKALIHASSAIGADKMIVPNKNFTEEQWVETFRKLGVPESIDDYEVKNNLPEGMKGNDDLLKGFRELAHKAGVLPRQAQQILDFYNEFAGNDAKAQAAAYRESLEADQAKLKQEWGNGFEKNMNLAEQALDHFFPDAADKKALIETGFLDTIEGTKFFKRLGDSLSEDHFRPEAQGGFGDTIQELDAKIKAVHGEMTEMGKFHPQYQAKLQEYQNLLNKRHGTKPVARSL